LSPDQVETIVEQQRTKYQIDEEFDKFLREVENGTRDGEGEEAILASTTDDGEAGKFV